MNNALLTPPSSPPPPASIPSTPESRIGKTLGHSLQLQSILGKGAYGVVYKAVDLLTGIPYAVKALSKTNQNGEPLDRRQREFQSREIQLHYRASAHPNIVSMHKIVDDAECTYVILEYCEEGDLFANITERCRYVNNDALVRRAFGQILDAVEHCHRNGIYHRDLKPENILVSGNNVLLADFGLATTDLESDDHGCGSTFYMSPECLDQSSRKPSYRCAPNDIWSLGIILVNLACGRNPWKQASVEDSTYRAFTKDRSFLKTILPLSDDLNDILCRIFERNPEHRISIYELKQRINSCSSFSAPSQVLARPDSPRSQDCSTETCEFDSDSGYGSDSDTESVEQRAFTPPPAPSSVHSQPAQQRLLTPPPEPTAPATQYSQRYVLPQQEYHGAPWHLPPKAYPCVQVQLPMVQRHHPYQRQVYGVPNAPPFYSSNPYYGQYNCPYVPIDSQFSGYSREY